MKTRRGLTSGKGTKNSKKACLTRLPARKHGGSDGCYLSRFGIPVIMSRPFVGQLHSQEEWIDIASMETLYRIYDAYLEAELNPSCA